MDETLFTFGILTFFVAAIFLLAYLYVEKGTVFDPIAISWAGFIIFVPGGMITAAIYSPNRYTKPILGYTTGIIFLGVFAYVLGLYSGRFKSLARKIPTPTPTLSSFQLIAIWSMAVPCFLAIAFGGSFLPGGLATVVQGLSMGFLGTIALTSLMGILSRQGFFLKVAMAASTIGCTYLVLRFVFSRRPLIGMMVATLAFFYREKVIRRPLAVRLAFLGVILGSGLVLGQVLAATRGARLGIVNEQGDAFGNAALRQFMGGIQINWVVYEYIIDQFPESRPYLMGSGYVPAFLFWIPRSIWPDKPDASGWVITQMYYNESRPENNLAPIFIGEAYCNFGVLGVVVVLFITGKFVRLLNTYLVTNSHNQVLWLAWLLASPDFASEWRGDFTSMTVQGLLRVIVFLGLALLMGTLFRPQIQSMPQPGYRLYSPRNY